MEILATFAGHGNLPAMSRFTEDDNDDNYGINQLLVETSTIFKNNTIPSNLPLLFPKDFHAHTKESLKELNLISLPLKVNNNDCSACPWVEIVPSSIC